MQTFREPDLGLIRAGYSLDGEGRDLVKFAQAFANNELRSADVLAAEGEGFPASLITSMGRAGLLSLEIPEGFGGQGIPPDLCAAVLETIAWGWFSASSYSVSPVSSALITYGDPDYVRPITTAIAAGTLTTAFGLSEANAGSDIRAISTQARRDGKEFVLSGEKSYITNAASADVMLIFARAARLEEPEKSRLSMFLVERDRPGVQIEPGLPAMAHNSNRIATVSLDNVRLPEEKLIGEIGDGRGFVHRQFPFYRVHYAFRALGLGRAALEWAVEYALNRRVAGMTLAEREVIREKLAITYSELEAARQLALNVAGGTWGPDRHSVVSAVAKNLAAHAARNAADLAVQVGGAAGYVQGLPERFYRESRLFDIGDGSREVLNQLIGGGLLRHV